MVASTGDTLLDTYNRKRDFTRTAEPAGKNGKAARRSGLLFCIQKHAATRLHYDFRIEWEGVLKSWAVTRGPSLDPSDKRLAVRTEDHPMDYGDFEGTIPKGQYGGGTVMLWDTGTWEPEGDADEGLARGNLKMVLRGEKLSGRWVLVRMKPRGKEKNENWLLIKEKDETADPDTDLLVLDRSVKTGRSLEEIAAGDETWKRKTVRPGRTASAPAPAPAKAGAAGRKRVPAAPRPRFRAPQLATLVEEAPAGDGWLHEMKYDGYRVMIALGGGEARCFTRNEHDWTDKFTGIAEAAGRLRCESALIDGEVVAFDANGGTDFSALQQRLSEGGPLSCFCFDLLSLDGEDLTGRPLLERKQRLAPLIASGGGDTLLYSEHVAGSGPAVFRQICSSGHEGIVSKRADAPYRSGRGKSWLKIKCGRRQEFVIGGYRPSDKKSRPFSSILVGVNEDGVLRYRGRVGSGFDETKLADLKARFDRLARKTSPFEALPKLVTRQAKFVEPSLVAEIEFAEYTGEGHVRHGVFKGLREDKAATAVVDEAPAKAPGVRNAARSAGGRGDRVDVAGIRLSNPGRILFESQGISKLDLARYFEAVAERMLVYAGGRPLSLVRCPQGRGKQCFFQKHDSGGFPEAIRKVPVEEKDGGVADYLYVDDAAGLVAAVQMGTMEFHIWGSRNDRLDRPDRLVFDLDPDEGLGFADVREAAFDLRDRLAGLGLRTFPLLTGGKGVHVVAPLARRAGWEEVKGFSRGLAQLLAREEPQRFVATMSKAKRKGRIFIDWLRNERGATAIAPFSTRSRQGAPVATPVGWDELNMLDRANGFDPAAVLERAKSDGPWKDYDAVRQNITARMLKAAEAG